MHHDADVVRNDAHPLSNHRAPARAAQVEHPVLLGHAFHDDLRMLEQRAEALVATTRAAQRLAPESLAPGVDYSLTRHCRADDCSEHGERAIVPRAGAN